MTINMSHRTVRQTMYDAVCWAVDGFVDEAVFVAVSGAVLVAVHGAVSRAVDRAVFQAVRTGPPHPNLQRFLTEVRQAREGVA